MWDAASSHVYLVPDAQARNKQLADNDLVCYFFLLLQGVILRTLSEGCFTCIKLENILHGFKFPSSGKEKGLSCASLSIRDACAAGNVAKNFSDSMQQ